ncbi:hypothetical protein BV22DRAFT_1026772, partial [Leucogyrophana mollusca]
TCCDGIQRRFYPRIFTYSADYPEKILIATVRNLGGCPCPRCLIPMSRVPDMGKETDILQRTTLARTDNDEYRRKIAASRKFIYEKNFAINYAKVEDLLKPESLLPTSNAFSETLSTFGFNLFSMLVVDLMHELELGVWKSIFIHLLRILDSKKEGLLNELDRRYRQVPTFGRDTIRRFARNVSDMKQMTAHDFEDILQCAIPVFESLLPEPHNSNILQLLFLLAHWHGLAKLRMHSDDTLGIMEQLTKALGAALRAFQSDTCPAFQTKELQREVEARQRRQLHVKSKKTLKAQSTANGPAADPSNFSLETYKFHALGDYTTHIRQFGTTDSYSTELGELEHRTGKSRYARTSRKLFVQQLTQIERRQARIRRIKEKSRAATQNPLLGHLEDTAAAPPEAHHVIGSSQNNPEDLMSFVKKTMGDPASKDFITKLKVHLHPRIKAMLGLEVAVQSGVSLGSTVFTSDHLQSLSEVILKNERIYKHNIIRINYTSYDVQRAQDVVNPRTEHCNILLLAQHDPDDPSHSTRHLHPFCYAKVLGIYHANVIYVGPGMVDYRPKRMEFLWVRWYELVEPQLAPSSWYDRRLDIVQFVPMAEEDSFGFVDPLDVVRSCHLIPAFSKGKLHPDGVAMSHCAQDGDDWKWYYVNRFVDRDMVMRYHHGLGVGHAYAHREYPGQWPEQLAQRTDEDSESRSDQAVHRVDQGRDYELEMLLEDREADNWNFEAAGEGEPTQDPEYGEGREPSDEELLAMEEMYGSESQAGWWH